MAKVSLIVSVYDKAKELKLLFQTLVDQSFKEFEVIIAEDGDSHSIAEVVEEARKKLDNSVIHLTQEDKGFRKNKILNRSILTANSDYLIFIDGDCLLHKDFIGTHFFNRRENTVLCGRRVFLSKKMSEEILKKSYFVQPSTFEVFITSIKGDKVSSRNAEESLIIKNKFVRNLLSEKEIHILGCNFSIQKDLLIKINGFDENYEGPGLGEDSDIEFRLKLIGAEFKSVRNLAIQYHIFHFKTKEHEENKIYYRLVKEKKNFFCDNGIIKVNSN